MKIVAILGSPHGLKGSTGTMLREVLAGAERADAMVTTLSLSDHKVEPCRGCNACHVTGVCPIRDDFAQLKSVAEHADGVVLASPNYIFQVSAQLKAFLDRCCGPLHCQAWEGKYGAAVVTSGGPGSDEVERYMLRFLRAMGCWTVGSVGTEAFRLTEPKEREGRLASARQLGGRLAAAIEGKAPFADQEAEKAAFRERMKQLVTMRRKEWVFEYEYWKEKGWVGA